MKHSSEKSAGPDVLLSFAENREGAKLRILMLEDNPEHSELVEDDLRAAGIVFTAKRVETAEDFREGLLHFSPGLILSDYDLPDFNGARALQMAKDNCPDVPFILVTGAIGEERAIEILTSGATDYVLKNRMARLAPAVQRALQEVRERKEREKAEISFQTLVEQIPAVIYRVVPGDQSGFSYLYVSPQSEWILGMPHAEFLNNPDMLITRIHPLDKKSVMEEIKSCWQEQRSFCFEYRIFHSDGRVLWFHDEAVLVRNKAGLPLYYQGILTDITQMKETEKELRQAHDTLEVRVQERTEELEAFTSSISHDLRGPIWMLDRYIQMIVDDYGGKLEPDLKSRLGTIAKTVNQMDRLIDALLHLSRVNRTELSITPLDLKEIFLDAWEEIRNLNSSQEFLFTMGDLPAASGDSHLIRQVMYNLLSNAVKFSKYRQRPLIEVGGYNEGENSIVYVRDNGVGFDMEFSDRLFGLFQRLHGQKFEGTGVGLAIVDRIVRRHGGYVKAEGRIDEGATFTFSLPRQLLAVSGQLKS